MENEIVEENASEKLPEGEPDESTTANENENDEDTNPPYFMDVF